MKQIHPFRRGGCRRLVRFTCAALTFMLAAAAFPAAAYAAEGENESPAHDQSRIKLCFHRPQIHRGGTGQNHSRHR